MTNKWVSFFIADEKFCANISDIKEVLPYQQANPFPGSDENTEGILSIRGEVITVLDGNKIFSCENITAKNNIIVIEDQSNTLIGISINGIDEIIEFDAADIEKTSEQQNSLVQGTINSNGQLYIVADLASLLAEQQATSEDEEQVVVSYDQKGL